MSVVQNGGPGCSVKISGRSCRAKLCRSGVVFAALAALALGGFAVAEAPATGERKIRVETEAARTVLDRLLTLRPNLPVVSVTESPVEAIVQLNLPDGSAYYGTKDGRFLFAGELYRLDDTQLVNVDEERRVGKRRALLAKVNPDELVTFGAVGRKKASIYVFTDVDCGFCQKLHLEVPALNARGIEVNYLAYPRAGINSKSYDKIVSAWCSEDSRAALTALKAGREIEEVNCDNPVASQYELGQYMGISGTPAIVLEDGTLVPGYRPAAQLAEALGI